MEEEISSRMGLKSVICITEDICKFTGESKLLNTKTLRKVILLECASRKFVTTQDPYHVER